MDNRNKLVLVAAFPLVIALVVAVTHFAGVPMKDVLYGTIALTLYGVLILLYGLRFAMIILGVFAVFKLLQEQHNNRLIS